jgi:hypothetical protein
MMARACVTVPLSLTLLYLRNFVEKNGMLAENVSLKLHMLVFANHDVTKRSLLFHGKFNQEASLFYPSEGVSILP